MALVEDIREAVDTSPLGQVYLTEAQRRTVVYTKYESQNQFVSDIIHGPVWEEQYISHARLGLNEDHGCIVNFTGTQRGEVAITPQGQILTAEEADMWEETSNGKLPRFMAYDFRIKSINKTDGPERRTNLLESFEQKKLKSEASMFDSVAQAFTAAVKSLQMQGRNSPNEDEIQQMMDLVGEAGEKSAEEKGRRK